MEQKIRKTKKISEYGRQLQEKQELKKIYGIREAQFRNYVKKATKMSGSASENLLSLLELRVDNVIFRAGFAKTRKDARQKISHRLFTINNKPVNIPSYSVKAGDTVTPKKPENFNELNLVNSSWFKVNQSKLSVTISRTPVRSEIDTPIDENLVIQFYSK